MPRAVSQNHISSSLSLNYTHPLRLLIIFYPMMKPGLAGCLELVSFLLVSLLMGSTSVLWLTR